MPLTPRVINGGSNRDSRSMPPLSRVPMAPAMTRSRSSLVGSVQTMPTISEDDKAIPAAEPPSIPTGPAEKRLSPLQIAYYRSSLHFRGLMTADDFTFHRPANDRRANKRHISPLHNSPYATYPPLKALLAQQALEDDAPDRYTEKKRKGFRDSEWMAWRGGWCRILCLVLFAIIVVIALAVGLTVGLRKKSSTSNSAEAADITLFPSGSYSFTAALTKVDTSCTNNSNTFRCYPYSTYSSSSPDTSAATFYWVITPINSFQYSISSSNNPFAPMFSNITMDLIDGNQDTERLNFNFTMNKGVIPAQQIVSGSDVTTTCYFNQTIMSATIWTKMRADYPLNITNVAAPINASSTFSPWPYAVEIQQQEQAGANVPDCRNWMGLPVASEGTFSAQSGECGCYYSNHALGGTSNSNGTASRRSWNG